MAEYPKHINSHGNKRDSKSEIIIEQELNTAGIAFEYGVKIGRFIADFRIHHNGKIYIWEHLGLLDEPNYKARWEVKKLWYEENGYKGRIITTRDHDGSIDVRDIKAAISRIKKVDSPNKLINVSNYPNTEAARYMNNLHSDRIPVSISAVYDPKAVSRNKSSNVCFSVYVDKNKLPEHVLEKRFSDLSSVDGCYVVKTATENTRGSKFIRSAKTRSTVFLRISPHIDRESRIIMLYCDGHPYVKCVKTHAFFVEKEDGIIEMHIEIPDPIGRKEASRESRRVPSKESRPKLSDIVKKTREVVVEEGPPDLFTNSSNLTSPISATYDDEVRMVEIMERRLAAEKQYRELGIPSPSYDS